MNLFKLDSEPLLNKRFMNFFNYSYFSLKQLYSVAAEGWCM